MSALTVLFQHTVSVKKVREAARLGVVLALSPSAMEQCQALGFSYLTPESFVSFTEFKNDIWEMAADVAGVTQRLDKALYTKLQGVAAFYAERRSLWTLLAELLYIVRLVTRLRGEFSDISLLAVPKFCPLSGFSHIDFDVTVPANAFGQGLVRHAAIFHYFLPSVSCSFEPVRKRHNFYRLLQSLVGKTRLVVGRAKRRLMREGLDDFHVSQPQAVVLTCGIGYGFQYLQQQMEDTQFLSTDDFRFSTPITNDSAGVDPCIESEWSDLLAKWLPSVKPLMIQFLSLHYNHLRNRIPTMLEQIENLFAATSPDCLLYQFGLGGLWRFAIAAEATSRGVPLLLLSHSGVRLHRSPAVIEQEEPECVEHITIYQGQLEASHFEGEKSFHGGNILSWKMVQEPSKPSERILFIHGGTPCLKYRGATFSSYTSYQNHVGLLKSLRKNDLFADIKIHVTMLDYDEVYFSKMIARLAPDHARVIKGSHVENIMPEYGLIIVENPGSLPTYLALALDVPVVFHNPSHGHIRDEIYEDLAQRVYFSKAVEELSTLLCRYKAGDLPSKGVAQAREDFMWPTVGPSPIERVAGVLRSVCCSQVDSENFLSSK